MPPRSPDFKLTHYPLPGLVAVMTPIWYGPGRSARSAGVNAMPIQVARSSSLTNGKLCGRCQEQLCPLTAVGHEHSVHRTPER